MAHDRAQKPGGPQGTGGNAPPPQNPQPPPSTRAGTYFLGRYRIVDEIGIGGMASVHLARMDGPGGFQKWVAIKRIHPHLVEDDTFVHMFLDEARVAARISHPNVATVFELGKHEDTYWIAMEYLHGEPLRELMRRTEELGQSMPPEIACRVIADAAEGLHAAHELLGKNGEKLGLVHRDVTPHNLFVTYDGNTKVVDFGIAKFSSRMASTRAGTLKGKLAYMSPEQVQGEQIDRRTDVFALGVVLWELTTGQRLFRMDSDLDTLAKVQECNVPRPSTIVRGYPVDLEKIVMKALAKNRNERFRTARELSRSLQQLLMRRGLFVASDEVASYVQQIFEDRIRHRDAHLRWAAEVTQTINLESHVSPASVEPWSRGESTFGTYNSEVHPSVSSNTRGLPRPAAGQLPTESDPPRGTRSAASSPISGPPSMTGRNRNSREGGRPTPGADAFVTMPETNGETDSSPHPSFDEGNTIRASAPKLPHYGDGDFEGDDDFDDGDDTLITTGRMDFSDPIPPVPAPLPAAGQPYRPPPLPPPAPREPKGPPPPPPAATASRSTHPAVPSSLSGAPRGRPLPPSSPPGFGGAPPPTISPTSDVGALSREKPIIASPLSSPALSERRVQSAVPTARIATGHNPTIKPADVTVGTRGLGALVLAWRYPILSVILLIVVAVLFAKGIPSQLLGKGDGAASGEASSADPQGDSASAGAVEGRASPPAKEAPSPSPGSPSDATGTRVSLQGPAPSARPAGQTVPPPEPRAAQTVGGTPTKAVVAAPAAAPAPPRPANPAPTPVEAPRPGAAKASPPPENRGDEEGGQLQIICIHSCDQVTVDGKTYGPNSVYNLRVPYGEHKVKLQKLDPPVSRIRSIIVNASAGPTVIREAMVP